MRNDSVAPCSHKLTVCTTCSELDPVPFSLRRFTLSLRLYFNSDRIEKVFDLRFVAGEEFLENLVKPVSLSHLKHLTAIFSVKTTEDEKKDGVKQESEDSSSPTEDEGKDSKNEGDKQNKADEG